MEPSPNATALNHGQDDDDNLSFGSYASDDDDDETSSGQDQPTEEVRDERAEVKEMTRKDTFKVEALRVTVLYILLWTAMTISLLGYEILKGKEIEAYKTAFGQFALTVGDGVILQQTSIRSSLVGLANVVSSHAVTGNLTWPFVTIPMFEMFGETAKRQANVEFVAMVNRVSSMDRDGYVKFVSGQHEDLTKAAHILHKGNLDRLNSDTSLYSPYLTMATPEGFIPDIDDPENGTWGVLQVSPPQVSYEITNWNPFREQPTAPAKDAMLALQYETVFSVALPLSEYNELIMSPEEHEIRHRHEHDEEHEPHIHFGEDHTENSTTAYLPHVMAYHPIHRNPVDQTSDIVGSLATGVALNAALVDLLPDGVNGIVCVMMNNMDQAYTYEIRGRDAVYLGEGDLHDTFYEYEKMQVTVDMALHSNPNYTLTPGNTQYKMHIYPSASFKDAYTSSIPMTYAVVISVTFIIVAFVFFLYDMVVQNRNENLVGKAAKSNAIVASLFPEKIAKQLMHQNEEKTASRKAGNLKNFLEEDGDISTDEPMADLFLDTTVLFADISGFTAWSSSREPKQVFTLLEAIFAAFDLIAKRRRIFKVETIGDCYVAVCGLPDPNPHHAISMVRFASDILAKMNVLTRELETTLGPDTADLALRVGVHSGPVTAGVLRGERARFQLFGDTMNTCSRLESSGKKGHIHASKETADLIEKAGKGAWLEKRSETVVAKGKGELSTYWINTKRSRTRNGSVVSRSTSTDSCSENPLRSQFMIDNPQLTGSHLNDERTQRLINWNVETLLQLVKEVVANRGGARTPKRSKSLTKAVLTVPTRIDIRETPLDEVMEIISLPEFDSGVKTQDLEKVNIPEEVTAQLRLLVSTIASMYNDNPFHNFDHASHVVMSVVKLLSRIAAPTDMEDANADALHDHTYGITSDPLTRFACAFSALIHDVDHVGVSNAQLVKEGVPVAAQYNDRSVAEQNSLDLSWELLMSSDYDDFRAYLFPAETELIRFRKLVVNSVMATDIVDKELKERRNARWEKAFKKGVITTEEQQQDQSQDDINRKATIVIEHIIQASDISHTMQHWHVYLKWNQRLFEELYLSYLNGRMEKDPSDFWWKGEFGFFDFYIIPLTQKLKECGVFGVSSGEYLDYAKTNRKQWELQGEEVVAGFIEEARAKYGVKGSVKVEQGLLVPGGSKVSMATGDTASTCELWDSSNDGGGDESTDAGRGDESRTTGGPAGSVDCFQDEPSIAPLPPIDVILYTDEVEC